MSSALPHRLVLAPLALTGGQVDRGGEDRRQQGWLDAALTHPETRVLALAKGRTPVQEGRLQAPRAVESAELLEQARVVVWLGRLDSVDWVAVAVESLPEQAQAQALDLREASAVLGRGEAALLTQAQAVLNWHAVSAHCPRCGAETDVVDAGWVRKCREEGTELFPRTDPAVIVLVTDSDDRVLLGANAAWGGSRFSLFAGFVEPGESLEEAVVREVHEEAGVRLGTPVYAGSQPWPFPASLMLGFSAQALDTASVPDGEEILSTRWFTREELRRDVTSGAIGVPGGASIAGSLLEAWYGGPLPTAASTEAQA